VWTGEVLQRRWSLWTRSTQRQVPSDPTTAESVVFSAVAGRHRTWKDGLLLNVIQYSMWKSLSDCWYPTLTCLSIAYYHSVASPAMGRWGTCPPRLPTISFTSLWSKSDSQQSKCCVVCEISWCRCQQLTALSISTAVITKLLVIKQLLHPALKSAVSALWHNF